MQRKQINRIIQMPITIHAEADIQKAVTQIHLAAGKASKGGRIEITIVNPEAQAPQIPVKALTDLIPVQQQTVNPEVPTVNPGSENKPPDPLPSDPLPSDPLPLAFQIPPVDVQKLVQKAQQKILAGNIPSAKERKALEEWEKSKAK